MTKDKTSEHEISPNHYCLTGVAAGKVDNCNKMIIMLIMLIMVLIMMMIIIIVLQELLQEKLTIAISNAEGFGLE